MRHDGSEYFARRPTAPPRPLWMGLKVTISEHGHVAYQIKWNRECSNMVTNILPADTYPPHPKKVKFQLYHQES